MTASDNSVINQTMKLIFAVKKCSILESFNYVTTLSIKRQNEKIGERNINKFTAF